MKIFCCTCDKDVQARLTDGKEIYPHRGDLASLPFWKCDACGNYVGCHHKTANRVKPLGVIPSAEIRNARRHLHDIIDPIWREGLLSRRQVYAKISEHIGREYHTAELSDIEEAREIYRFARDLGRKLRGQA